MCLAVPAVIVRVQGREAEADMGGVRRRISLVLTPEAGVGDYVLIHTGFALHVLDESEALESLRLLKELEPIQHPSPGTGET